MCGADHDWFDRRRIRFVHRYLLSETSCPDADLCLCMFTNMPEDAVSKAGRDPDNTFAKRMFWFVALWLLGVVGTALLVLPFHLLVSAAMHH